MIELYDYQLEAIEKMKTGSVLWGGVGSGKSRTALAYYLLKDCEGDVGINGKGTYRKMKNPKDLYIITTAKKRDSLEWTKECLMFPFSEDRSMSHSNVSVTIDSWNNIKKYKNVYGAFFIFDEQRVVGTGVWVKTFLDIARKNHWILLSATPGDTWSDYIPLFVANGFYRNKTDFNRQHCVFNRYSKFPKIDRYVGEKKLRACRDQILIPMKGFRIAERKNEWLVCEYDKRLYDDVFIHRWDPYDNCPIKECSKWYYLQRRVVNSDPSRLERLMQIYKNKHRLIVFYNYNYELDILREWCEFNNVLYSEWNGQKHEDIPFGERWVYLVQYSAGSEGWNCITTNTVVFYSQNYSYRMTEQASGRIDRVNTEYDELYYYHLWSISYIDKNIYRSLKNKKKFNEDPEAFKFAKNFNPIIERKMNY